MSTLQGLDPSPAALAKRVYEDASSPRPAWKGWPSYLNEAASRVSKVGIEVGSFKVAANLPSFHRWTLLAQIFTDVELAAAAEERLAVFVWDEITLYLYDLVRKGAHDEAGLLPDRLRTVRQTCPHLRMAFAGSIGLDEVPRELKERSLVAGGLGAACWPDEVCRGAEPLALQSAPGRFVYGVCGQI